MDLFLSDVFVGVAFDLNSTQLYNTLTLTLSPVFIFKLRFVFLALQLKTMALECTQNASRMNV